MSYIGNTPTQQNFVAGADQFSGTGSQTVFTLSRAVNTVFDIFVTVANVPQDPFTAYTVAGNTLSFDGAPASGTNNIDVVYRATNVQTFVPSPGVSQQFAIGTAASPAITFVGDTNTGIYSPAADTIAFTEGGIERMRIDSSGNVGIGTTSPGANSLTLARGSGVGVSVEVCGNGTSPGVSGMTLLQSTASDAYLWNRANSFLSFGTNNTERARIDASGNVGIGTSSPTQRLDVSGNIISSQSITVGTGGLYQAGSIYSDANWGMLFRAKQASPAQAEFRWANAADTELARITTAGLFQFNSGYGSVATAYGCRAWVNFNGTGTVAIRASGNVSSITDNGTGNYTVNFTNAMPDANFCALAANNLLSTARNVIVDSHATNSVRVLNQDDNVTVGSFFDASIMSVAIFR